jgi:ureidoglycolate hydrolase
VSKCIISLGINNVSYNVVKQHNCSNQKNMKTLPIETLQRNTFKAYGDVIEIPKQQDSLKTEANQGTASKFHRLAQITNLRPQTATANLCIFQCQPRNTTDTDTFIVKILERHLYSNQIFMPMADKFPTRYLVVVALNDVKTDRPDLSTLKCFLATGEQGVNYSAGCWHHPMIALDDVTNFMVYIHEDGSEDDCHVVDVEHYEIILKQ